MSLRHVLPFSLYLILFPNLKIKRHMCVVVVSPCNFLLFCLLSMLEGKTSSVCVIRGAGTATPSGTPEFTRGCFLSIRVAQSFVFCVLFCWSLFVHCPFYVDIVFSALLDLWRLITILVPSNFSHEWKVSRVIAKKSAIINKSNNCMYLFTSNILHKRNPLHMPIYILLIFINCMMVAFLCSY